MSSTIKRDNDRTLPDAVTCLAYLAAAGLLNVLSSSAIAARCVKLSRRNKHPIGTVLAGHRGNKNRVAVYRISVITTAVNQAHGGHAIPTLEAAKPFFLAHREAGAPGVISLANRT